MLTFQSNIFELYRNDDEELIQVNWLEVTGCIDNINIMKKTSYNIEFIMALMADAFGWSDSPIYLMAKWLEVTGCIDDINIAKKTSYNIEFTMSLMTDAFGWSDKPIYLMAKWGDNTQWRKVNLATKTNDKKMISETITIKKGKGSNTDKICFGLYEVWNKKWKGGLKIHPINLTQVEKQYS